MASKSSATSGTSGVGGTKQNSGKLLDRVSKTFIVSPKLKENFDIQM